MDITCCGVRVVDEYAGHVAVGSEPLAAGRGGQHGSEPLEREEGALEKRRGDGEIEGMGEAAVSVSSWRAKVNDEDGWVSEVAGERVGGDGGEGVVDGGLQVHTVNLRHFTFHTSPCLTSPCPCGTSTSLHDHFSSPSIVLKH